MSMPQARSTFGLTMPQPPHSTQPAPPFFSGNHTSTSADGSVKGKNDGRSRVRDSAPNMARAKCVERALEVRHRDAGPRPGPRPGGTPGCGWRPARRCGTSGPGRPRRRAARAPAAPGSAPVRCGCAGRASRLLGSVAEVERVLHGAGRVVLPKFSASKLSHADSTSGPSATSQPIADEHVRDPLADLRDRVPGAARGAVARQRDVDGLLDQHPLVALGLEHGAAGVERLLHLRGAPRSPACPPRPAPGRAATRARGGPAARARGRRGARA